MAFDDPAIEKVVRRQLQQLNGPVTRESMHKIKTFNVSSAKIDDLDPCVFAELTGVKDLTLPAGGIRDLLPIKPLIHVEGLFISAASPGPSSGRPRSSRSVRGFISGTAVTDLTPIAAFGHLDRLNLSHTQIADLTSLVPFTLLTELQLDDTTVVDLSPLAKLPQLEVLSLQNTPVQNLTPLHALTHLKKLYIAGTLVTDISPVQGIPRIKIFQQASR